MLFMAGILAGCAGGDLTLPGDGSPASLTMVSGDGQQGRAGKVLSDPRWFNSPTPPEADPGSGSDLPGDRG